MDERHWWIATKLQETFQVDETDSPTALEQFFLEPNNFDLLTQLLGSGGINKLFVYGKRPEARPWMVEDLNMVPTLINLKGVSLNEFVCVYLLRPKTEFEVSQVSMHKQIMFGEIKNNPLHQLSTVLSQVFMPLVKAKEDWGKCSNEHRQQFIHSVEKYSNILSSATNRSNATNQQILRLPDQLISREFSQHRISSQFDATVVQSYEEVLQEWMQSIEGVLSEGAEDRILDMNAGPLSELDRWKRRQRVLGGITEQLKSKECKNIIGVLIQAKSRSLRAWRSVDILITDAQNESKDKVKYLEALRRHFEQLHSETNPISAVNVVLPTLVGAIRQMDSISRFYARSGYLGLLCMKIDNQLALVCREYVGDLLKEGGDLWNIIEGEIEDNVITPPTFKSSKKGSKKKELIFDDDGHLMGRLQACLAMQAVYKETIKNLRETLATTATVSHSLAQSVSSLDAPPTRSKIPKRQKLPAPPSIVSGSDKEDACGISLFDDEAILGNLDLICGRVKQLLDFIATLRQYTKLAKDTAGLARPRLEDIPLITNESDRSATMRATSPTNQAMEEANKLQNYSSYPQRHKNMFPVPEEDEDIADDISSDAGHKMKTLTKAVGSDFDVDDDSVMSSASSSPVQSQYNAAAFLRHLYSTDDGPSLSAIIADNVATIIRTMSTRITTSMLLDLNRKHKERFDDTFAFFSNLSQNLDQLLLIYLQAIFSKPMKTQQGLDVLSKFNAVSQRASLREEMSEHYSSVYAMYSKELENVQNMYEQYKNDPIMPRDAPPAAGAIYWSRQLLSHIEEPMQAFQENKSLSQNKEFHKTVKFYNKLATALVMYETLWYQQWSKSVDNALAGLKFPLLKQEDNVLMVNSDPRILSLIHESKWMLRMKLDIPESARLVLQREKQYKKYKIHLEQCLHEYNQVCSKIPEPFAELFQRHIGSVIDCLKAGLNTITWDSMNIDAFLHKTRSTTQRLNTIVDKVNQVIKEKIEKELSKIEELILFDDQLILGKSWLINQLLQEMSGSIEERSQRLRESARAIEGFVNDIIMILSSSRINSADHQHASSGEPSKQAASKKLRFRAQANTSASSTSSSPSPLQRNQEEEEGERNFQKIFFYYSQHTYNKVLQSVCQTLFTLCNALSMKADDYNPSYNYSRPGSSHSSSDAARTDSSLSYASMSSSWEDVGTDDGKEGALRFHIKINLCQHFINIAVV